jgi:hypothetical protein
VGIWCCVNRGPTFTSTSNYIELSAYAEPFNGDGNCRSWANKPGYSIGVDAAGKNTLTNSGNGLFTISELEVWEIINVENLPPEFEVKKQRGGNCNNQ